MIGHIFGRPAFKLNRGQVDDSTSRPAIYFGMPVGHSLILLNVLSGKTKNKLKSYIVQIFLFDIKTKHLGDNSSFIIFFIKIVLTGICLDAAISST